MITVNKTVVLKNAFEECYCKLVAERLHLPKWNMPNRWGVLIDKIIGNMEVCRAYDTEDVARFVEAQFYHFKFKDCLVLFHLKYPPVNVFLTSNARQRYRHYILQEESYKSNNLTDEHIMGVIAAGTMNNKDIIKNYNYDKIKFGLINGDLSVYVLAHCVCKSILPAKKIMNCVHYAAQYVTDDLVLSYDEAIGRIRKILTDETVFFARELAQTKVRFYKEGGSV